MATTVSGSLAPREIAALVAPANAAQPSPHYFAFVGSAREYFGIWMVNVLLTALTFGIYLPWALVRTRQYFHGSTQLSGIAFGYHARPTQILKGRLIAVAALIAYGVTAALYPWFELVGMLLILPAVPWIVVRALRFGRRVVSHRHLRFGFAGTVREAFEVYVVLIIGAFLTAGVLYPHALYRRRRYVVENSHFGQTGFRFDGRPSGFYGPFLRALGAAIIFAALVTGAAFASGIELWPLLTAPDTEEVRAIVWASILAAALFVAYSYVSTRIENYAWSRTLLGSDRFSLDLAFGRMLWLYLSNLLAIVATFGLMIPWAQVRLARYRLSRLRLQTVAGLEHHLAARQQSASAIGQELGTAFDVDIGL